ncbi:MAG: caspase family protein [Reichenbachiella sp.]
MKFQYSLTFLLAFSVHVIAQSPQVIVNATGHTGKIRSIHFTSQNELFTIGEDKSIRWWDFEAAKELDRKYLNSSSGSFGMIYTSSFCKKLDLIALGGFNNNSGGKSVISIINSTTRKLVTEIQAFDNPVTSVNFTSDGNKIIAGSKSGEITVWQNDGLNQFSLDKTIDIGEEIYDISISKDDQTVALTSSNRPLTIYSLNELSLIKELKIHYLPATKVAYSLNGEYLVSGGEDGFVNLYTAEGKFIKKIAIMDDRISSISISRDSKVIVVLTENTGQAKTFSLPAGSELSSFNAHNNTAYAAAFHPNSIDGQYTIASSGGNGNELLIWNGINGGVINKLDGGSTGITDLAFDKKGNLLIANDRSTTQYEYTFSLSDFALMASSEVFSKKIIHSEKLIKSPFLIKNGQYKIQNNKFKDGRILKAISLSKDSTLVGSDFSLKLYVKGQLEKEYLGHHGGVRSILMNENYIISGAEDEVIHFWKRNDVKKVSYPFASLFIKNLNDWVLWTSEGYFTSGGEGSAEFGWLINNDGGFADQYKGDQFFSILYRPEQVAEAFKQVVEVNQLIVSSGSRGFDLSKIQRPAAAMFISPYKLDNDNKAFILPLKGQAYQSDNNKVVLRSKVHDGGSGISSISVYQNTKLIFSEEEFSSNEHVLEEEFEVNLLPGINQFKIVATNLQGIESRPNVIDINYTGEIAAAADLYVFAIGINEYLNPLYNLNYAYKDAVTFLDQIQLGSARIFENVHLETLYDKEAYKENIIKKFEDISNAAHPQDVFVFYYAGHGTIDLDNAANSYYLVPHDITQLYGRKQMLKERGISSAELKSLFANIPAQKQLILLDACHSGGAADYFAMRGSPEEKAIVQLARSSGTVVLAASGSQQFATEFAELGHGVFTHTLLEGLKGNADGGEKDGKITVNELKAYMEDQVPQISEKYGASAQFPTGFSSGQDFPLSVYKD